MHTGAGYVSDGESGFLGAGSMFVVPPFPLLTPECLRVTGLGKCRV